MPRSETDDRPVRVLLVAAAATREYQFVRNLLARDADKSGFRLAVSLQAPPGRKEPRDGVEQGATLLKAFPDALASYDVIVAFDPDWTRLDEKQMKLLQTWVEGGGGLVVVAGPVNTAPLSRKANAEKLRPILDLYPVVVGDNRLDDLDGAADGPFVLHFSATDKAPAFLKLDPDGKGPLAGWQAFFGAARTEKESQRGFYGAYPVDSIKPGATVWATLADPKEKTLDGGETPFLAGQTVGKGRVVYLGSGELWRLRTYREVYHNRFWMGLIRYTAQP